jgi:branched-chain amino acid transport system ATP-binding protein
MAAVLTGRGINKRFGGSVALCDVDFHLGEGEILGLIGPNGAGKTTLINIVSGNLRADAGTVSLNGRTIDGLPAHQIAKLGVARTFQLVRPFLGMTVEENILVGALFGRARGVNRLAWRERKLEEILEFLDLRRRRSDAVGNLNIPERKKVELARALAMEPSVLLLDELVAGLNPMEMESLMGVVRQINRQGVSLLIVEHVMRVVTGLCDRVIVLHHGQKLADGPTDRVLSDRQVAEAYLGKGYVERLGNGFTPEQGRFHGR